jgi:hypothetical protein
MAIQGIQIYQGSAIGADFIWDLRDLGVTHRAIPRGCAQAIGKVERSNRTNEDESTGRDHEFSKASVERLCEARIGLNITS